MGLYGSQLEIRQELDRKLTERAFDELAASVSSPDAAPKFTLDDIEQTDAAAISCLKYLHVMPGDVPESIEDPSERIEWLCRPTGTMTREVNLEGEWYKRTTGAMMGSLTTGEAIALLPRGISGYSYIEPGTGRSLRITKDNAGLIGSRALLFYKPLPARSLEIRDFLGFIAGIFSRTDYILVLISALVTTLIGLLPALANDIAFEVVVPSGRSGLIIPIGCFLLGAGVASAIISACRNLVMHRISNKLDVFSQAAVFSRVLSLPGSFFKDYSPGDIANRISNVPLILQTAVSEILGSGLSVILTLIYVVQIYVFAPMLALPALIILLIQVVLILIAIKISIYYNSASMQASSELSGTVTSLLGGVQKLKLSGAEDRAFAKWAQKYSAYARYTYNLPLIMKALPVFITLIGMLGNIVFYYEAGLSDISVGRYMAFTVAYGHITVAITTLANSYSQIVHIIPMLNLIKPILNTPPEISDGKPGIDSLTGSIEVSDLSFRYGENDPYIIKDLSFKVKPGEYVGIVGRSGCGKSTIMRLLLGMETPKSGFISYGSHDIKTIDIKSLRRLIGVVMQNGKLFTGDIFNNITVATPKATLDDAWEAAEIAGIADDIRKMPMEMHTLISEGNGGVSGGQKQRILIARAICGKRKILMFDEATSALDNITQKHVSDSLDKLSCTRIVIAHRLSTVRNCDRILVVDKGHIAEEGSYDELIARKGLFYELVKRQQLDD